MRPNRLLLLGSLSFGLLGCDMSSEDEALAREELAASGWIDPDHPHIPDDTVRWRNTPILVPSLEIHVCDESEAGTDDYVTARFQIGTGLRTFTLDRPGNDFERNSTNTFYLPTLGGSYQQLNDLGAFWLEKTGTDGVCIDRLALRMNGVKVWEYDRDDGIPEKHKVVLSPHGAARGKIWIDEGLQYGLNKARFTERHIRYETHGPMYVHITTCDVENAGTDDYVRVSWVHDGIAEPARTLDTPSFNDFERGSRRSYLLSSWETFESIDKIRIEKDGTDGWCVAKIAISADDDPTAPVLVSESPNKWLDGDGSAWVGMDTLVTRQVAFGGIGGWLGYPLSQARLAFEQDFEMRVHGSNPFTQCRPPARIRHEAIEGVIETLAAAKLRGKGYQWGNNSSTKVTRWNDSTLLARTTFKSGSVGATMDFRISFTCPDGVFEMKATPAELDGFGELPNNPYTPAMIELFDGWDPTSWLRLLAPVRACPSVAVDTDGDVELTWGADSVPNARCRLDSDPRYVPDPR